jgi:hypothetical protein
VSFGLYERQSIRKGLAETDINLQTFQSAATTAETKQDTPDYDGSYAASTFSGLLALV